MKTLQDSHEEHWKFTSYAEMRGVIRRHPEAREVFLLLHGLGERGKRIYRKLLSILPETSLIIAPDGPFPLPRPKEGRMSYGHSWYFYDKFDRKYYVTQDLAKFWLRDLLDIENPGKLPVTIIGFSQGGYLAPLAGKVIKETKLIVGLACEFRTTLIQEKLPFPMVGIHGADDEVVKPDSSLAEIEKLKSNGHEVEFITVKETAHEITSTMAMEVKNILERYGKRSL